MANPTLHQEQLKNNRILRPVRKNTDLYHKGNILFRMGDEVKCLYLVMVGTIKLYKYTETGEQQIIGFYMPGDIIGLDSIAKGKSQSIAEALDTTHVSRISFDNILTSEKPLTGQELLRKISSTINRDNELHMILSQRTADRRLAWFLAGFSDKLKNKDLPHLELDLPMSRTDIAVFLGLALETVSRELAKFCEKGFIKKGARKITIINLNALRNLAKGEEILNPPTLNVVKHAMAH